MPAAVVTAVSGKAFVERNGQRITLTKGMELSVSDVVHTEDNGKLSLLFADKTELDLHNNTHAALSDFVYDQTGATPAFAIEVFQGLTRLATGEVVKLNPEGFAINTPLGTAGIRGTEIWSQVSSKEVVFTVTEMGKGHMVVVTGTTGQVMFIKVPESGVVITQDGQSKLDMKNLSPEELQRFIKEVVGQGVDDVNPSISQGHGFFVIGDAEFLATVGALDVAAGFGFVPLDDSQLLIDALANLSVPMQQFFLDDLRVDGHPSDDPNPPNPPVPPQPPFYFYGTPGPDNISTTDFADYVYAYTGNDTISTGKGDDTIYSAAGKDYITAGYGSSDSIYKQAPLGGSTIIGDEGELSGVAGDGDFISIGTSASEKHFGFVYGDAVALTSNAMPGNDTINVTGVLNDGEVIGDAVSFFDVTVGVDTQSGDTATGQDQITLTGIDVGGIYGDATAVRGKLSGSADRAFSDTITVDNMNGGVLAGDFNTIESAADFSGLSSNNVFSDKVSITNLTSGHVYGDAVKTDAVWLKGGHDSITIGSANGNACIYGDFYEVESQAQGSRLGNDTISINGASNSFSLYGDAPYLSANNITGDDVITIGGMHDSALFGDTGDVTAGGIYFGNDSITVTGTITDSEIHGDADQILSAPAGGGNDTFSISGTLAQDGDVFGDAQLLNAAWKSGGHDSITVGTINGGYVYGDFHTVESQATNSKLGNDVITVNGAMTNSAKIFGDAESLQANNVTAGNDTITIGSMNGVRVFGDFSDVKSQATNSKLGNDDITVNGAMTNSAEISGDADTISATGSVAGNDTITIGSMTDATVSGDAYQIDADGITLGNDVIVVKGDVTSSVIYGDTDVINNVVSLGADKITISGTMSGSSAVYGDAYHLNANLVMNNDSISVNKLKGGALIGDVENTSGSLTSATFGSDTLEVTGTLSGGVVIGDVADLNDALTLGNDSIKVNNMTGGKVIGDANNTYSSGVTYGNDHISMTGTMTGGIIYGDIEVLNHNNAPGRDTISLGAVKGSGGTAFAQIHGDAADLVAATALSGHDGNDKISATSLCGVIFGDAKTLSGYINLGFNANTVGAFADEITVTGVMGGMLPADDFHVASIYGDFFKAEDSINIYLNGYSATKLFSDTITVGTLENGQIFGEGHTVGTYWDGFGHDQINVTNLKDGLISGDFNIMGTASGYSILGNDSITVKNANGGTIVGDYFDAATVASNITGGNDTIKLTGNIQSLRVCGDADYTTADVLLGHDLIDASTATLTNVEIYGDGYMATDGINLQTSGKVGFDQITIGTLQGASSLVIGDFHTPTGTLTGLPIGASSAFVDFITITTMKNGTVCGDFFTLDSSNPLAFSTFGGCGHCQDFITITSMEGGSVYGDATSINQPLIKDYTDLNFSGFIDNITITNMSGGKVYGDAKDLTRPDDNNAILFGTNQITVSGIMSGGTIYGSAETFTITGSGIGKLTENTINIGTLKGGTVYSAYKTISGTDQTTYLNQIKIDEFQTGSIYGSTARDQVTLRSVKNNGSGASIDFGGTTGTEYLTFDSGFTFDDGSAITLSGTAGNNFTIHASSGGLTPTVQDASTVLLQAGASTLTLNVIGDNANNFVIS